MISKREATNTTVLPTVQYYKLALLSNLFFFLGSLGYQALAALALQRTRVSLYITDVPEGQQYNDWVLLCASAFCFIVNGVLDMYNEGHLLHICMILAGFFGFVSALVIPTNDHASNVLNLLSVHFFLLEAFIIINRDSSLPRRSCWVYWWMLAAFCFFGGSLIDVVLSYIYLDGQPALETYEWTVNLNLAELISATLWLTASVIHVVVTLGKGKRGMKDPNNSRPPPPKSQEPLNPSTETGVKILEGEEAEPEDAIV